jgi:hypothetical protein
MNPYISREGHELCVAFVRTRNQQLSIDTASTQSSHQIFGEDVDAVYHPARRRDDDFAREATGFEIRLGTIAF